MLDFVLDFLKFALLYAAISAPAYFLRRRDALRAEEPAGRRGGRIVAGGWLAGPTADIWVFGVGAAMAAVLVGLLGVLIWRTVVEEGWRGAAETFLIAGFFAALIGAGGIAAGRAAIRRATFTAEADAEKIVTSGRCVARAQGRWEDLHSVRPTLFGDWFVFTFGDAHRVMVLQRTRGLDELMAFARERAPKADFRIEPGSAVV